MPDTIERIAACGNFTSIHQLILVVFRNLQTNSSGGATWSQPKGAIEDEQDRSAGGSLTMWLFMLGSLDSCLLKFSIHVVSHESKFISSFIS